MPTDYTGDPAATQSPSGPPIPETAPVVRMPNDGEAANVASIYQELKALADHAAWLFKARAQAAAGAAASNWGKHIMAFRNAKLQKRWGIDHMGFPHGQLIGFDENWDDANMATEPQNDNGNQIWVGPWRTRYTGKTAVGGIFQAFAASGTTGQALTSRLYMEVLNGGATTVMTHIERATSPIAVATGGDVGFSLSWDSALRIAGISSGVAGTEASGGILAGGTMLSTNNNMATAAPAGLAIIARGGVDNTWKAYSKPAGGSATYTDTGVSCTSPDVRRRFRIEYVCSGVSDDSTARANFYIDGNWVAGVAIDLTNGGSTLGISPFVRLWTQGSTSLGWSTGPMRFRANTWAGDVFI